MPSTEPRLVVHATAYKRPQAACLLAQAFLCQRDPRWRLHVVHDGPDTWHAQMFEPMLTDRRITYAQSEERKNEHGHDLRAGFLGSLSPEEATAVLLTNDDNYYVPCLVSVVLGAFDRGADLVYWDCIHSHYDYGLLPAHPTRSHIDLGSFAVSPTLAKEIGFVSRDFAADWFYFEELIKRARAIFRVPQVLFVHN